MLAVMLAAAGNTVLYEKSGVCVVKSFEFVCPTPAQGHTHLCRALSADNMLVLMYVYTVVHSFWSKTNFL